jgi:biopolymer transport protein ExbD
MQVRRSTRLLVEPSAVTTGDIAFNLIVFFLVCASAAPDSGRRQNIPRSETIPQQAKTQHIEVQLTRTTMAINGDVIRPSEFAPRLRKLLASKTRPEDQVVIVKSRPEVPYHHWITATSLIEEAGGIITIQREEEREIQIPR